MMVENLIKSSKVFDIIEGNKIFPVIRAYNAKRAVDISKALIEGGLKAIEITFSFNDAPLAIEEVSKIDKTIVAAGSIITAEQAAIAVEAGAKLIVSPILEMSIVKFCKGKKIPLIAGAATPTEAYEAWKIGVNIIKIFPAQALGGSKYIKNILTPMPFLHLMPAGGVNLDNFTDYLDAGAVAVGMGQTFYGDENDLATITQRAKIANEKLAKYS